jgi:hypothetical protein
MKPKKSVLFLTLKREFFDAIKAGTKKKEYREIKPWSTSRLVGKHYDYVLFQNGYNKGAPQVLIEYLGYEIKNNMYVINLGKIKEKNDVDSI